MWWNGDNCICKLFMHIYWHAYKAHMRTIICTHMCVGVPGLPSLQCNDDWVSPLDWVHSCSAIPLSTVRNHLVSLGLLQSNWPFKEGLHHVKQCNWEWYSCCSSPHFVLHSSTLAFLSFRLHLFLSLLPLFPGQLLSVCLCFSTSCSCCTLSSADSRWPLNAQCCSFLCYHFQLWLAPWLDRLTVLLRIWCTWLVSTTSVGNAVSWLPAMAVVLKMAPTPTTKTSRI